MHLIRRKLRPSLAAALGVAAVCSFAGVAASTPDAHAATRIPVTGLPGFGQAVVDMATSRVFVSEGTDPSSSNSTTPAQGIVVTDLSGNYLTTIDEGTGAQGLTLAPDGKLYAALSLAGKVAQIDPATYSETDYPLPAGDVPQHVAAQSGKVWVSYDTGTAGAIGDITPGATSSFQDDSILSPSPWSSAPLLAADPSDGGTVVAASTGQAPPALASFDVSGASPTVNAHSSSVSDCAGQATQVAVLPGGGRFTVACNLGSPQFFWSVGDPVFSTTDLSEQGLYGSPGEPGSIAVAPDGATATGSVTSSQPDPNAEDLAVFDPGTTQPATQSYALEGTWGGAGYAPANLAPGGLAWGDSTVLAAVLAENNGNNTAPIVYEVHVITYPLLNQSQITLGGINPEPLGQSITIAGGLDLSYYGNTGGYYPSQTVTLSRTSPDGTTVQIGQTTTSTYGGRFTFSDTPPALGTYTYTVSFAGDPATNTAPDTTSRTVTVLKPAQASLQLPQAVPANQSFKLTGVLTANGAPAAGKTMNIWRTASDGTEVVVGQAVTDSSGAFTISDTLSALGTYTYTASFFGDEDTGPASATGTVTVLDPAQITLQLPKTALPNQTVDASGSLAFASGASASGKTVTVTRSNPDGTTTTLTVTTDTNGSFSFKDKPSTVGTYTYTARYADSATGTVTGQASASVTVAKES
jgi:5-hydroxyisourate hydrolase-like protein (transthyretin family)